MKAKYFLIVFVVLFLVFIGIWILSPKVGEKIDTNTGVDVEFIEQDDTLPTKLPDGYVRYKAVTDAIVYRQTNEDNTVSYYEYVGNEQFIDYDIDRPYFLIRSSFDKKIYQIINDDKTLREEYRAFDGKKWLVVSKTYDEIFTIPENYTLMPTAINLYIVKDGENFHYKVLTKIGKTYAWVNPNEDTDWIATTIPSTFEKTETTNVYKGKDGEKVIYKKVLAFNDTYKTIAVVPCDETGKFI